MMADARHLRTQRVLVDRAQRVVELLFPTAFVDGKIDGNKFSIRLLDLLTDACHALKQRGIDLDLEKVAKMAKQIQEYEASLTTAPLPEAPG